MSGEYTILFKETEDVVVGMAEGTAKLNSTLAELDAAVRSRLAEWEGAAQASYQNAKLMWDDVSRQCAELSRNATQTLDQIRAGMSHAELKNQGSWADVAGGVR